MIEIICLGKNYAEAKTKCMVTKILLTEKRISKDTAIKVLNVIGGIYITESEDEE